MNRQQIQLVKRTWRLLREVDPVVLGDVFYGRLFLKHPSLRSLFKEPMKRHYQNSVDTLSMLVGCLDRLDTLTGQVSQLAQQHVAYDVKPEYYVLIGEALFWTLEKGLGSDWDVPTQQAWSVCYRAMTQAMLRKPENQAVENW